MKGDSRMSELEPAYVRGICHMADVEGYGRSERYRVTE